MKFNFEKKIKAAPAPNIRHISVPLNPEDPEQKDIWENIIKLQSKYNATRTDIVRTLLYPAAKEALDEN